MSVGGVVRAACRFALAWLLLWTGVEAAQAEPGQEALVWPAVTLPGTQQQDIDSRHTGRRYRIFVSVPATPPPASGYPVVYLLDGNAFFPAADSLARVTALLGPSLGLDVAAPLVVGIGSPAGGLLDDRARGEDYTPPAPDLSDTGDRRSPVQGGADRFLDFIEQELKPLVEQRFRVDRSRQALVGHSYGGLFVLHALFTRPQAFEAYVAGSPSIWWNDRYILGEKDAFVAGLASRPVRARLLLTVGELESTPVRRRDGIARDGLIAERAMVENARALAKDLVEIPHSTGLRVVYRELPGENHYGSALPMLQRAFEFLSAPSAAGRDTAGSAPPQR